MLGCDMKFLTSAAVGKSIREEVGRRSDNGV